MTATTSGSRRFGRSAMVVLVTVGLSALLHSQSASRTADLVGAWGLTAVQGSPDVDQPTGVYIFTKKHYAAVARFGGAPIGFPGDVPEEQLRLAWKMFEAEAGEYDSPGSGTITWKPIVAKGARAGAPLPSRSGTYTLEGQRLRIARDGKVLELTRLNKSEPRLPIEGPWRILENRTGEGTPATGFYMLAFGHYINVGLRMSTPVVGDGKSASHSDLINAWYGLSAQGGRVEAVSNSSLELEVLVAKQSALLNAKRTWRHRQDVVSKHVTLESEERGGFVLAPIAE